MVTLYSWVKYSVSIGHSDISEAITREVNSKLVNFCSFSLICGSLDQALSKSNPRHIPSSLARHARLFMQLTWEHNLPFLIRISQSPTRSCCNSILSISLATRKRYGGANALRSHLLTCREEKEVCMVFLYCGSSSSY